MGRPSGREEGAAQGRPGHAQPLSVCGKTACGPRSTAGENGMMSVQMPFGRGDGETLGRGALSSVSHLGLFSRWVLAKASGHQVAKWTGASRPLAVPPLRRTRRESRWASGAGRRREAASAATASASASSDVVSMPSHFSVHFPQTGLHLRRPGSRPRHTQLTDGWKGRPGMASVEGGSDFKFQECRRMKGLGSCKHRQV